MNDELKEYEKILNDMSGSNDPVEAKAGHMYFEYKEQCELKDQEIAELKQMLQEARQALQDVPADKDGMYSWAVRRWHETQDDLRKSQKLLGKCMHERGQMEAALQNQRRVVYLTKKD